MGIAFEINDYSCISKVEETPYEFCIEYQYEEKKWTYYEYGDNGDDGKFKTYEEVQYSLLFHLIELVEKI